METLLCTNQDAFSMVGGDNWKEKDQQVPERGRFENDHLLASIYTGRSTQQLRTPFPSAPSPEQATRALLNLNSAALSMRPAVASFCDLGLEKPVSVEFSSKNGVRVFVCTFSVPYWKDASELASLVGGLIPSDPQYSGVETKVADRSPQTPVKGRVISVSKDSAWLELEFGGTEQYIALVDLNSISPEAREPGIVVSAQFHGSEEEPRIEFVASRFGQLSNADYARIEEEVQREFSDCTLS